MSGIVAIVGRPNVGKSTLFNRLVERRDAIVDATAGVTRDRHYGKSLWNGVEFSVIDTGGYMDDGEDTFQREIDRQVQFSIEEADVILFLLDVKDGLTPLDKEISLLLRRSGKPVMTVLNKVDSAVSEPQTADFYSLGMDAYYSISGINGSGTGDLLDGLIPLLPETPPKPEKDAPRFAVIGRPNAGKSSFINALLGEDRHIVTEVAGTTRDSSDTFYNQYGFEFYLTDTAGIRRKAKVKEDIEFYSVMRAVRAIEQSDVCLLLVDASRQFEGQDNAIFWLAERNKKGIVILVNKWDLIEKSQHSAKDYEQHIKSLIAPFVDVPIVFVSVTEKQRLLKAIEIATNVYRNKTKRIPTKRLNEVMLPIISAQSPPSSKGKFVKIKFCTQLPTAYPQFVFFANLPQYVKDPYKRFLENQLRAHFDFTGVPIQIFIRKK